MNRSRLSHNWELHSGDKRNTEGTQLTNHRSSVSSSLPDSNQFVEICLTDTSYPENSHPDYRDVSTPDMGGYTIYTGGNRNGAAKVETDSSQADRDQRSNNHNVKIQQGKQKRWSASNYRMSQDGEFHIYNPESTRDSNQENIEMVAIYARPDCGHLNGGYQYTEGGETGRNISNSRFGSSLYSTGDSISEMPDIYFSATPKGPKSFKSDKESNSPDSQNISIPFVIIKVIVLLLIIWDVASDWVLTIKFDDSSCNSNTAYEKTFDATVKYPEVCGSKKETLRQVLSIFTVLGTVIGVLQIFNILLGILHDRGVLKFKLVHPQTELYISLYLEEIPQAVIIVFFYFNCDCGNTSQIYALLALLSGIISSVFRFATGFTRIGGEDGCCNTWWRCCCFKNKNYMCDCYSSDCWCTCHFPCPLFCCTLQCIKCKWTPHIWCRSLFRTFSCYCGCCSKEESIYGIRIMNIFGIMCLLAGLTAKFLLIGIQA